MNQRFDEGWQQMAADFASASQGMVGTMRHVFETMSQISATGNETMIRQMTEAWNTGAPADAMLTQMKTILEGKLPPTVSGAAGLAAQGMTPPMEEGAAAAGQSAALILSQEFAAASTHIQSVLKGPELEQNYHIPLSYCGIKTRTTWYA
jgi:hypothetical protein